MRVIAGIAKGRKLESVPGDTTRPILDRVKTALFDTIRPELEGAEFLDMFAGSGAVGVEALSQGASHCVFCDLEKKAVATIKKNLETTQLSLGAEVRHTDAFLYLKNAQRSFDFIYIAPPQYKNLWEDALTRVASLPELLNEGGQVLVQIDPKERSGSLELSTLKLEREKSYGNSEILFFRKS